MERDKLAVTLNRMAFVMEARGVFQRQEGDV
jgi:hypothetical protein